MYSSIVKSSEQKSSTFFPITYYLLLNIWCSNEIRSPVMAPNYAQLGLYGSWAIIRRARALLALTQIQSHVTDASARV